MEKNAVIAIRDALLDNGNHRAIRICFDNGVNLALSSDLVIWDDDNEIVIGFCADSTAGGLIANLPVKIICSTYENIQFIMSNTNVKIDPEYGKKYSLEDLPTIINNLKSAVPITDESEKKIINWFSKVCSHEYDLSHKAYNDIDIIRD